MWGLREVMSNSKIVKRIMRSLLERFYPKVIVMKERKYIDKIKVEELVSSLQTFELKLKSPNKDLALKLGKFCNKEELEFARKLINFIRENMEKVSPSLAHAHP